MSSLQLKTIEQAKIDCARAFFKILTDRHNGEVVYNQVDSFGALMDLVAK